MSYIHMLVYPAIYTSLQRVVQNHNRLTPYGLFGFKPFFVQRVRQLFTGRNEQSQYRLHR